MNKNTRYQEALDYLYSFIDFSLQRNFRLAPEQFDLGRMDALMERLGNPQNQYPLIHIAGTKGKGSVSAMCASILQQAGYRVGLYTSPHLWEYTERMQINREPISEQELVELIDEIKPHVAAIPRLTTFEIGTALGMWYFARQGVNAAVIEVGMGGRLDSTNIVLPVVAVITSLSYDHAEILGDTLAKIAAEKAGIIKAYTPVVLAPQKDEALRVVKRVAGEHAAPLLQVGKDLQFAAQSHSLDGQRFILWENLETEPLARKDGLDREKHNGQREMFIPMLGLHQIENAAVAFAAVDVFRQLSLSVSDQAMEAGLASVSWPGRFELLRRDPPVVIDSAHNRDSAAKLRATIDEYFPDRPVVLVFGASADKDIQGMYAELLPRVSHLITAASYHPRAADPEMLVSLAADYPVPAEPYETLEAAMQRALLLAGNQAVVLVAGSIFVAAGAMQVWKSSQPARME
ncbi:MAG: bifunctional folylpolyglutamate synthase/dihydrofolate synthase [Anaerolineales bacterium]|jgi:dihydrofolate synthase/folylpolyglutamate synthase